MYTRALALLSVGALALWGWLAAMETDALVTLFQSPILIWGPALWFLYLALRFGSPRSVARFYVRGLTAAGRTQILLFGLIALGSLALGLYVGLPMVFPKVLPMIEPWGLVGALVAALVYVIVAHFGSRPFAFSTGLVQFEGEPVLRKGTQFNRGGMSFPYRG